MDPHVTSNDGMSGSTASSHPNSPSLSPSTHLYQDAIRHVLRYVPLNKLPLMARLSRQWLSALSSLRCLNHTAILHAKWESQSSRNPADAQRIQLIKQSVISKHVARINVHEPSIFMHFTLLRDLIYAFPRVSSIDSFTYLCETSTAQLDYSHQQLTLLHTLPHTIKHISIDASFNKTNELLDWLVRSLPHLKHLTMHVCDEDVDGMNFPLIPELVTEINFMQLHGLQELEEIEFNSIYSEFLASNVPMHKLFRANFIRALHDMRQLRRISSFEGNITSEELDILLAEPIQLVQLQHLNLSTTLADEERFRRLRACTSLESFEPQQISTEDLSPILKFKAITSLHLNFDYMTSRIPSLSNLVNTLCAGCSEVEELELSHPIVDSASLANIFQRSFGRLSKLTLKDCPSLRDLRWLESNIELRSRLRELKFAWCGNLETSSAQSLYTCDHLQLLSIQNSFDSLLSESLLRTLKPDSNSNRLKTLTSFSYQRD